MGRRSDVHIDSGHQAERRLKNPSVGPFQASSNHLAEACYRASTSQATWVRWLVAQRRWWLRVITSHKTTGSCTQVVITFAT